MIWQWERCVGDEEKNKFPKLHHVMIKLISNYSFPRVAVWSLCGHCVGTWDRLQFDSRTFTPHSFYQSFGILFCSTEFVQAHPLALYNPRTNSPVPGLESTCYYNRIETCCYDFIKTTLITCNGIRVVVMLRRPNYRFKLRMQHWMMGRSMLLISTDFQCHATKVLWSF